ncbi:CoA transferase [Rhodococcus sp. DMU2021]|uniref:CoA transferase n=1 Tax=Rhodococcus sp. DMU2021 TaxID=2866997 RepID=UPI0035A8ABBD
MQREHRLGDLVDRRDGDRGAGIDQDEQPRSRDLACDGFSVAGGEERNDGLREKLCVALGRPELATDARFLHHRDRIEHRSELDEVLTAAFATGTVQHWCRVLEDHGVPVSPIRHLDEIYSDPHTAAIGMVGTVDHASGPLEQIAFPVNFGGVRPPLRSAPPLHGEHTDEILAGYQEVSVPS